MLYLISHSALNEIDRAVTFRGLNLPNVVADLEEIADAVYSIVTGMDVSSVSFPLDIVRITGAYLYYRANSGFPLYELDDGVAYVVVTRFLVHGHINFRPAESDVITNFPYRIIL